MREVEAQMARIDQRACLLHVLAQHLAQRGVQQVRASVVAHGRAAHFVVDHGIDFVADADGLTSNDSVCPDALNGRVATANLSDHRVVIIAV